MRLYIRKYSFIVAAIIAFILATAGVQAGDAIAASELVDRINTGNAPLILDVRTPREYTSGHVPGAVNISLGQLRGRLAELDSNRDSEIVVYCWLGPRAGFAQSILSQAGFTHIRALEGHMQGWEAGGYPIE
ncbi:MAG: rhodanese-like domain-containing protein [Gammaproteobacteria bacterium]